MIFHTKTDETGNKTVSSVFSDYFNNRKLRTGNAEEFSNQLESDKRALSALSQELDANAVNQERFRNIMKGSSSTAINYAKGMMDGKGSVEQFASQQIKLNEAAINSTKLTSKLKSFGSSVVSSLANIGVGIITDFAIQGVFTMIDNYVHRLDIAIEKGAEANAKISQTFDNYKQKTLAASDLGNRYEELSQGVNPLTKANLSLSDDKYTEFLEISNQLAGLFPTLVSGYDSQGNALLTLGNGAQSATDQLNSLLEMQRQMAHVEISNNLQTSFDGATAQVEKLTKQISDLQSSKAETDETANSFANTTLNNKILSGLEKGSITLDSAETDDVETYESKIVKTLIAHAMAPNLTQNDDGTINIAFDSVGNDESLADVRTELTALFSQEAEDSKARSNDYDHQIAVAKMQIADTWANMTGPISNYLQTAGSFTNLSETLQGALLSNLGNLDIGSLTEKYNGDVKTFLYSDFIEPISELTPEAQEALGDLLNLDKSDITYDEYTNEWQQKLNDLFPNDVSKQSDWKNKLGFTDFDEELQQEAKQLKEEYKKNTDDIDNMTLGDKKIALDIIANDDTEIPFDKLLERIEKVKKAAAEPVDIHATPLLNEYIAAKETQNAGSNYDKMRAAYKEAKALYESGDIGTDDFKKGAAVISPTGAEDVKNFEENSPKADRYLTDDESGIENFLKDLESKKYAELETLQDGTKKLTYDIQDLESAAYEMSLPFELFMSLLGELSDKGFSNNFISNTEDGLNHLEDLYGELADEEQHLAKLQGDGKYTTIDENGNKRKTFGDQTAIDASIAKIAELKAGIQETKEYMSQLTAKSAEDAGSEVTAGKAAIFAMQKELKELKPEEENYNSVKGIIEDDIKEIAKELHIELDADLNIVDENGNPVTEESVQNDINKKTRNVNITSRPQVPNEKIQKAGWETEDTDYSPIYSSHYSNEDGTETVLLTPVLPDGTVLSPEQLSEYAKELLNGQEIDADVQLGMFAGEDSIEQAENYAQVLSAIQEQRYSDDETQQNTAEALGSYTAEQLRDIDLSDGQWSEGEEELENYIASLGLVKEQAETVIAVLDQMHLLDEGGLQDPTLTPKDPTGLSKLEVEAELQDPGGVQRELQSEADSTPVVIKTETTKSDTSNAGTPQESSSSSAASSLPPFSYMSVPGLPNPYSNLPSKEQLEELVNTANNTEATITVHSNTSPGKIEALQLPLFINSLSATIPVDINSISLASKINAALSGEHYIKVTPLYTGLSLLSGVPKANGTPFIQSSTFNNGTLGKALALGGTVGEPRAIDALTGELGQEMVVRGNRFFTVGDHGPEMVHLRQGDIVFNHRQTRELLSRGHTAGRGRALAEGNVKSVSGNSDKDAGSSLENVLKRLANLFDWIEHRIDRLQGKIDYSLSRAENAVSYKDKNKYITKAAKDNRSLIHTEEKAYKKYTKKANQVAAQTNLPSKLKKQVNNGTNIRIKELSEENKKRVDAYKQWRDKALDAKKAVQDLKQQQKELAQTRLDNIIDQYESITGLAEAAQNTSKAMLEYYTSAGKAVDSEEARQQIKSQKSKQNTITTKLQSEKSAYTKELRRAKKVYGENSNEYREAKARLEELNESIYESKTAYNSLNDQLRQLDLTKMQYVIDGLKGAGEKLRGILELKTKRGASLSETDYSSQIANNNQLVNQYDKMRQTHLNEMAASQPYSEKWQEAYEAVQKCDNAILGLLSDNEDLKDSINELRWKPFHDLQNKLADSISDLEHLSSLLQEGQFFDDDGGLTKTAFANIALIGKSMELEKQRAANARAALGKLQKELENGTISQEEYNERSREQIEIIQKSASSVEDYKSSLIDMHKTQLEKQNEVYQEYISIRKEANKQDQKAYEYQRKLKSQYKDVSGLKAQILALEGTTNLAAKAELERLKAELAEKQDDLDDTVKSHEYDMISDGYDKMAENAEKQLDNLLHNLETNADEQKMVVDKMLNKIKESYSLAYSEITNIIKETGTAISQNTKDNIDSLNSQAGANATVGNAQSAAVNASDTVNNINTSPVNTSQGGSTAGAEKNTYQDSVAESDRLRKEQEEAAKKKAQEDAIKKALEAKNKEYLKKAKEFINTKKKVNLTNKQLEGRSALFQYIYGKSKRSLNAEDFIKLGKILDVQVPKKASKMNGTYRTNILRKLKEVGYAQGTKNYQGDGFAWMDEEGSEMIVRKNDGAILTRVKKGDSIIPADLTENLWKWGAIDPFFMMQGLQASPALPNGALKGGTNVGSGLTVEIGGVHVSLNGRVYKDDIDYFRKMPRAVAAELTNAITPILNSELRKTGIR